MDDGVLNYPQVKGSATEIGKRRMREKTRGATPLRGEGSPPETRGRREGPSGDATDRLVHEPRSSGERGGFPQRPKTESRGNGTSEHTYNHFFNE